MFDEKDQFVQTVTIASHRKQKNFDIIKFKDMYHINDIEKYKGYSLRLLRRISMTSMMVSFTTTRLSV